ncbi:MAG: hypothetical protein GY723_20280 [bacterium]|nr:hypothetical protein [bacterium]MCP5066587.1 hypothetical protein [bacterium]
MTALLAASTSCTSLPAAAPVHSYDYFASPASQDPWSPKIAGWQVRELRPVPAVAAGPPVRDLRTKYRRFRDQQLRASVPPERVAAGVARWIQQQARAHYVPDGPIDHWATLEDTLANNGDDCDGLELLVYHALRDLGFGDDQVFRAVVYRPSDGQHHMVTFWFDQSDDPWVIDPTGAMTRGMPRMSEIPGWVPLKVFTEHAEWSVRPTLTFAAR